MSEQPSGKSHKSFGIPDFLWRVAASLLLVLITFNPSGYSYFHWLKEAFSATGTSALHYFVGAVLLAVGLSWAHIWRCLSGQIEVDEVHD